MFDSCFFFFKHVTADLNKVKGVLHSHLQVDSAWKMSPCYFCHRLGEKWDWH